MGNYMMQYWGMFSVVLRETGSNWRAHMISVVHDSNVLLINRKILTIVMRTRVVLLLEYRKNKHRHPAVTVLYH